MHACAMRWGSPAVALALLLACSVDRVEEAAKEVPSVDARVPSEDPRRACVREHPSDPVHAAVVRALCAELHDLDGVSASVAIVRDDRVVWSMALGPRCSGSPEPLLPTTPLGIGSVTKLVTTALALAQAERLGVGLDDPLADVLPELSPSPSLRALLSHTGGLRDPAANELLERGDAWPEALQAHRAAAGEHVYANANFLVVGRWLERSTGRSYAELLAAEPTLAAVRAQIGLLPNETAACGHQQSGGWAPLVLATMPPLPAWTIPAGGALASAEALARLPFALERSGALPTMLATRVPTDRPGWDYGLGIRMRDRGEALVLAHSGRTAQQWAEVQWSPHHRVAVAVVSSTPQAWKATLLAAFAAGLAEAAAAP